jgi:hypothetical protein
MNYQMRGERDPNRQQGSIAELAAADWLRLGEADRHNEKKFSH